MPQIRLIMSHIPDTSRRSTGPWPETSILAPSRLIFSAAAASASGFTCSNQMWLARFMK